MSLLPLKYMKNALTALNEHYIHTYDTFQRNLGKCLFILLDERIPLKN